jgi:hypothetical protein
MPPVNSARKFDADLRRILKHQRNEEGGFDSLRAAKRIVSVFEESFPDAKNLAHEIGAYWLKKYIQSSPVRGEINAAALDWIVEAHTFLSGEDDFGLNAISSEDWKELRSLLSFEAEDLPIALLTRLMNILMQKMAL